MNAFENINVNDRKDLYSLDYSSDGTVYVTNKWHLTFEGAYEEKKNLEKEFENEKLLKFCELDVDVTVGCLVSCNYCPAFLLQTLANMTAKPCDSSPRFGRDMKGKYVAVKKSFVFTSGKILLGGMVNPHMPLTYYMIAKNNFESIK